MSRIPTLGFKQHAIKFVTLLGFGAPPSTPLVIETPGSYTPAIESPGTYIATIETPGSVS